MPTSTLFNFTANNAKRFGAKAFDAFGVNRLGFFLQKKLFAPFVRAVNYHVVAAEDAASFEKHLQYYAENFVPVDLETLENFLQIGEWRAARPGLIISFDDGHRSHFETAAPLLEKYGFTGWFFVPVGLMNLAENRITNQAKQDALTIEQLKYLDSRHVVGSHTQTHLRLHKSVAPQQLEFEIGGSRRRLETLLRHEISAFCWVGGEEENYSREAARLVKNFYRYSFMTNNFVIGAHANPLQLQRTNIEAENPLSLVRFQLSGLMDVFYTAKRRRVNRLTA